MADLFLPGGATNGRGGRGEESHRKKVVVMRVVVKIALKIITITVVVMIYKWKMG